MFDTRDRWLTQVYASRAAAVIFPIGSIALLAIIVTNVFRSGYEVILLSALVISIALYIFRIRFVIYSAMLLGIGTLPLSGLGVVGFGPILLYSYEVPMLILVGWCLFGSMQHKGNRRLLTPWVVLLLLGVVVGVALQNSITKGVLYELRAPFLMIATAVVALSVVGTKYEKTCINALRFTLVISASIMILFLSGYGAINAIVGTTSLDSLTTGGAQGIVRIQSPTTHAALGTMAFCLILNIVGRTSIRTTSSFLLPATIITVLGFSRNGVIAIAVALVSAVIINRSVARLRNSILRAGLVGMIGVGLGSVSASISGIPGLAIIQQHLSAYADRVIGGLSSAANEQDRSTLYRLDELAEATKYIGDHLLIGHGLGFRYKVASGSAGSFSAGPGTMYLHNFYVWVLLKIGLLGVILFLAPIIIGLTRAARLHSGFAVAGAGTVCGFLVVIAVAPLPLGELDGGAVAFGAAAGVLLSLPKKDAATRNPTGPAAQERDDSTHLQLGNQNNEEYASRCESAELDYESRSGTAPQPRKA